ncbi:MAG: site-specific DNA-methyltransferase [Candidatus Brocadiia bacterium]
MPRLTDQERQDILRYIEADKPLPDKYRFLLFEDKREVELVWNGKTSEVCNIVLPFQVIEQVDEPRAEKTEDTKRADKGQQLLFSLDERGRQLKGWTNKLIWGDNKLILSSLKNGPMREEIEKQGGIKLIYIDPPFDVGADFSMDIEIGDDTFTKKPNILEEIAYRDTWGKGADSFIAMIHERLALMRDLLAKDGSIYVHCDVRVGSYLRLVLDELFGANSFNSMVIWKRRSGIVQKTNQYGITTDLLLYYNMTEEFTFSPQFTTRDTEDYIKERYTHKELDGRVFKLGDLSNPANRPTLKYEYKGYAPPDKGWAVSLERMEQMDREGRLYFPADRSKRLMRKQFLDEWKGKPVQNLWDDVFPVNSQAKEKVDYPTQKPEALLDRIIRSSSNEGDLVADFFCGSGTTAAVAEKLGRKWIVADLGKFGIHTTRKRMIGVQRELKAEGKDYRAFEVLNLGKYERQHYIGVNPNLREEEQRKQVEAKETAFLDLILRAYRAEKTTGFECFHGKRAGRLVSVGPVNLPVTRLFVEEIILECRQKHITKVDILGFEFEMGLFPNVLDEARAKGIDIAPKYIPAEVFDKRAVEKNQVVFHDVAAIEVKPLVKASKNECSVAVELTDFSVFYSQDSISNAEAEIKNKGSRIVVEKGQIVKVSKDAHGVTTREVLTKDWTDWIDYWAVDFDFESKREIIRVKDAATGEWVERWTGDYVFENEWQSFRTKKNRKLELRSVFHECTPGRRKIAVKVVDIFGNDTMTIVDVSVGNSGGAR